MSRSSAVLLLAVMLAPALQAQQRVPRRPRLASRADTNDAAAYFQLGLDRVQSDPRAADAAFYWASRLDPAEPQALYGRAVAQLLFNPRRLVGYFQREGRSLSAPDVRSTDSLRFRAEMQDPFLHRGLDELLLRAWAEAAPHTDEWVGRSSSGGLGGISDRGGVSGNSGIASTTESFLDVNDQFARGVLYYSRGLLREALQYYNLALQRSAQDILQIERARVFVALRQPDSALVALREGLAHRTGPSDDPAHHVYESTAAWHFAVGRLLEDRRDVAGARAAYQAALTADVAYYPAALRLGVLAAEAHDSAGALAAFQGVLARADIQFFACPVSATALRLIGRRDAANAALRRGTEIEPFASGGWLLLARALESASDTAGAAASFDRYLALAPRNDPARAGVTQALARLRP